MGSTHSTQRSSRSPDAVAYALASFHGVEAELLDITDGRTPSCLAYFPKVATRSWRRGPEMKEALNW
ncbi:DUF1932 domain-containing protein [Streptomyces sp. NPDC056975]|uniref:DUF1932 domain-containing protein n=1 Tax=unclassified Streptomyces TaxID=2593676 RepID=UPI00363C9A3C